jgi:hypothetical protein
MRTGTLLASTIPGPRVVCTTPLKPGDLYGDSAFWQVPGPSV